MDVSFIPLGILCWAGLEQPLAYQT